MTSKSKNTKILLLSANPRGMSKLRLDEEIREIKEGLRRSRQREQYEIDTAEAVRYTDIHRAILEYEPSIVHFSGHGTGEEGLVFEDETGQAKFVEAEALAGLFELFADQVECVVLNACYSEVQAQAIALHINYVIGMSQAIGDRAAIEFAVGFYDALGAGRPIEFAYKLGCTVIRMAGIPENLTPQLLTLHAVKGVDYTKLRDLLAAQKWQEADEETARVMCQAAHRQEKAWLRIKDIDNFPCEDLRTINKLWLHYSQGHFGFSVQKEIYQSLGGTNEYNEKVWHNFCEQVGWCRRGSGFLGWMMGVSYFDLTFSLNAPVGHLPGWRRRNWMGEVVWLVLGGLIWSLKDWEGLGRLFARGNTCNL